MLFSAVLLGLNLTVLSETISPSPKRSIQHFVYKVRKDMFAKHLASETDDTFGTLLQFAEDHDFSALLAKHNDPYHFDLFDFVVLGSELLAQREIVHITGVLIPAGGGVNPGRRRDESRPAA